MMRNLGVFNFSDFEMPAEFTLGWSMDDEPALFEEAMAGHNTSKWKAAWEKEISRLEAACT